MVEGTLPLSDLNLVLFDPMLVSDSLHVISSRRRFRKGWLATVVVSKPLVKCVMSILQYIKPLLNQHTMKNIMMFSEKNKDVPDMP